jgi:hypothetical protein
LQKSLQGIHLSKGLQDPCTGGLRYMGLLWINTVPIFRKVAGTEGPLSPGAAACTGKQPCPGSKAGTQRSRITRSLLWADQEGKSNVDFSTGKHLATWQMGRWLQSSNEDSRTLTGYKIAIRTAQPSPGLPGIRSPGQEPGLG